VLTDPDVADFVWRALGYALTGDMREQVFFLLFVRGSNGKSTLVDLVGRILGDYALTVGFSTFERERPGAISADVANLDGKRFVSASEGSGNVLYAPLLKDITGGERISARHLYGNPFTFRPTCKIFLSTNELPRVHDDSDGLWRRLRQVPFTSRFEGASDDRSLKDTLLSEAPGILAWLVRGCLVWQARGLDAPAAVAEATAQYRADCDPLGRFLDEACELIPTAEVRASELFRHYAEWADRAGLSDRERLSATAFGRKCSERFVRAKTRSGMVYQGVARA
jgi:putative DNA primase/helicase